MSAPRTAQLWEILYVTADEAGIPLRGARVLRKTPLAANLGVIECYDYRKTMPQRIVAKSEPMPWDDAVLSAIRFAEAGAERVDDPKQPRFFA